MFYTLGVGYWRAQRWWGSGGKEGQKEVLRVMGMLELGWYDGSE